MNTLVERGVIRRATSVLAVAALTAGVGLLSTGQAAAADGTIDRAAFGVSADGLVDVARTPDCALETSPGDCDKSQSESTSREL